MYQSGYPILLAVTSAALFGAATPASKALLRDFSPFQLAGLLYLGAAVGVLPAALWRGAGHRPWPSDRRNLLRLGGAIGFGGVVAPVCLLLGLQLASAASVALVFRDRHGHLHVHEAVTHMHAHRHDDGHHANHHPGQPASLQHSHGHAHEALSHGHPHWPDVHHRHGHERAGSHDDRGGGRVP